MIFFCSSFQPLNLQAQHAYSSEFDNMFGKRDNVEDGGEPLSLVGAVQSCHQHDLALLSRIFTEIHQIGEKLTLIDAYHVIVIQVSSEALQRFGFGSFKALQSIKVNHLITVNNSSKYYYYS